MNRPTFGAAYWCLALLLLCGCGQSATEPVNDPRSSPAPVVASLADMPSPAQLTRVTSAGGSILTGADFDPTLAARITPQGTNGQFAPASTGGPGKSSELAYALYRLDAASLPTLELRLLWETAPLPGQCFIGLADFPSDHWRWQALDASQPAISFTTASLDADENLPVVVVVTGFQVASLAKISVGPNVAPLPRLNLVDPNSVAPATLQMTAELSDDPDGAIVTYEYDRDGDGTYEVSTTDPLATQTYVRTANGVFYVGLRVTDNLGLTAETRLAYDTGFKRHWQSDRSARDIFTNIVPGPDGGYYVAGTDEASTLLARYDSVGNELWSYIPMGGESSSFARGLAPAADGGVYLGARLNGTGPPYPNCRWLAHISPDGQILWNRRWADADSDTHNVRGVAVAPDGTVYSTGSLPDMTGSVTEPVLLSFTADGQFNWARRYPSGAIHLGADVAGGNDSSAFMSFTDLLGQQSSVLRIGATGNVMGKLLIQNPDGKVAGRTLRMDADAVLTMCGAVEFTDGGPASAGQFVLRLNEDLTQVWAKWLPLGYSVNALYGSNLDASSGMLWISGQSNATAQASGVLLRCDSSGGNWRAVLYSVPGTASALWDVLPVGGKLRLCGDAPGEGALAALPLDPQAVQPLNLTFSTSLADPVDEPPFHEASGFTMLTQSSSDAVDGKAISGEVYVELLEGLP